MIQFWINEQLIYDKWIIKKLFFIIIEFFFSKFSFYSYSVFYVTSLPLFPIPRWR